MSVMLPCLLLAVLVTAAAADTDYCTITSCPGAKHTMCLYPNDGAADSCPTELERGVSSADQTEILTAHNDIRQAVKNGDYAGNNLPAAQTMPDLTWDDELADVAQRWVDQCSANAHDQCRDVPRFAVGQNAASSWKTPGFSKDWTADTVDQWFGKEVNLFTQTDLTFVTGTGTGHLSQVIWAETTKVGCGLIAYPETLDIPNFGLYTFTRRNYVCNYGPAGNYIGQEIYQAA